MKQPDVKDLADLCGLPIRVCEWLPKTVMDKDGNEVELLGVIMPPVDLLVALAMDPEPERLGMIMVTGKIVKPATARRAK